MQEQLKQPEDEAPTDAARAELVATLKAALSDARTADAAELCKSLKAPDLADIIELLEPTDRVALI